MALPATVTAAPASEAEDADEQEEDEHQEQDPEQPEAGEMRLVVIRGNRCAGGQLRRHPRLVRQHADDGGDGQRQHHPQQTETASHVDHSLN